MAIAICPIIGLQFYIDDNFSCYCYFVFLYW